MASYIGYHGAAATSVATTNAVGDLLLCRAFRSGSTTAPSLPASGWNDLGTAANGGGGTNNSARVGWRIATATNEGSGTWANATAVEVIVQRGTHPSAPIGGITFSSGNSTTSVITYPDLNLTVTNGTSWLVGFGARTTTGAIAGVATAPGAMSNRGSTPATPYVAAHTLGNTSSNWTATDVTPGGTNVKQIGVTVEVLDAPAPPIPPPLFNGSAGQRMRLRR